MLHRKNPTNVLLVDDSAEIVNAMTFLLEDNGYKVSIAANGNEALTMLKSQLPLPDVIVLDLMMPVMDGFAFRKEQLKDNRLANIPTIVATALAPSTLEGNSELGFQYVIHKPFAIDELLATIDASSPAPSS